MRIALAAVLAFAGLWFVALKPKPVAVDGPLPASPPVERKAQPAKKAEASTPAKAEVAKSEPKATVAKSEPKAAAKPAPQAHRLEGRHGRRQGRPHRRAPLLPPVRDSADDVAVRKAVKGVDRHDGKVRVHTASLGKLGQYEAITKAAKITSTPTVLVIDASPRPTSSRA